MTNKTIKISLKGSDIYFNDAKVIKPNLLYDFYTVGVINTANKYHQYQQRFDACPRQSTHMAGYFYSNCRIPNKHADVVHCRI